jgi:hypothetical protein
MRRQRMGERVQLRRCWSRSSEAAALARRIVVRGDRPARSKAEIT